MAVTSANHVFLPWVRQGAAAAIQTPDSLDAQPAGTASIPVKLRVNDDQANDVDRRVRLYGPGDVIGIDSRQVVRREPGHLSTGFEPNYFPAVEFDSPDFPWLFTPAKADTSGRLRPWICLIVVRKQAGVSLRVDRALPLPVLDIKAPARPGDELPDLTESWAWAHAQVTGSGRDDVSLRNALGGNPALTVSRLLCPRRLEPSTEYLACVVPAFELGCKAGLGLPITVDDEKRLVASWDSGTGSPAEITLPVYLHWEFRTGAGGDFESLVTRLKARDALAMPPEVGKLRVDISRPGFPVSLPPDSLIELQGALRLPKSTVADWPEATRTPFRGGLKQILDKPWLALKQGREPLLAPPIYGNWQAGRHTVETNFVAATPTAPAIIPMWLDELNLDPRHRAVAALGTAVIQRQQEALMASAWEQLGEIRRVNQMRRQAQLGRAVNAVFHARHFSRFTPESLLKSVAPASARLVIDQAGPSGATRVLLSKVIARSAMPAMAVSATLQRMSSPRGVLSARFQASAAAPIAMIAHLNSGPLIVAFQRIQAGLVAFNEVTDAQTGTLASQFKQVVRFERIAEAIAAGPQLGDFRVFPEGAKPTLLSFAPPGAPDNEAARNFRAAAKAHQAYLQAAVAQPVPPVTPGSAPQPMDLVATKSALLKSLDPAKTLVARVQNAIVTRAPVTAGGGPGAGSAGGSGGAGSGTGGAASGTGGGTGDPLEPFLEEPAFPQPMYAHLREVSQDFLLPGLEQVPADTVTLLETNSKFVEAYLVGLNAEMGREFLWRNFPTGQRGTFFRQFWDVSAGSGQPDIQPISAWGGKQLGENAEAGEKLVLLIRGELLRRYPNAVVYAVAAVHKDGHLDLSASPADEKHPLFRGTLAPDMTFLGFDLERETALADPGWFFVIQQQPTEPCFGMDAADFSQPAPPALSSWNNLSWRHLAGTEEELAALSHASIKQAMPDVDKGKWGRNSAHQAYITLQRPVRIAIHAKDMLAKEAG